MGDGHTSDLKHESLVCLAVEIGHNAIIIPRGARKAHLRSHCVGDTESPDHHGNEELGLVVGLNGTAKDRADLDVVLVVLAELHDAGAAAVMRVRKRMA